MLKKIFLVFLILMFVGCESPTQFSQKALDFNFITLDNKELSLKDILRKYKGKKILINIWASWCSDCIKGLPDVKKLQKMHKEVVFLFLSADRNKNSWKKGIQRFKLVGEHYFMPGGMKNGDFQDFIKSNWIPRYMVIDKTGNIKLFKATNASDEQIIKALS